MCFSAQASFLSSALLFAVWGACLLKLSNKKQLLLAFIPFFFGVQQLAEGILWMTIPKGGPSWIISMATSIFITIASFVWPLLIPLAAQAFEPNTEKKIILRIFVLLALAWTVVGGYQLFTYGVVTTIDGGHILYTLQSPHLPTPLSALYYCAAVLLPFFIASNRFFNLLGVITALSCIAAFILWNTYFVSVWCFFAALISVGTYVVIASLKEQPKEV